ncbi:MAG: globin domain-containing protein [Bacteroidota bacterium]|nr:globin domain-containing protein [Bacteroidota bacterium]
MTQEQKKLVQISFASLHNQTDRLSDLLYKKLFELEPKTQVLFHGDMKDQEQRLIRMLHIAVDDINDPQLIQPKLYTLGMIHHSYGIEAHHYTSFGEALIYSLRTMLGKEFTPQLEEAWRAAYRYLASTMFNFPHHEQDVQVPHN